MARKLKNSKKVIQSRARMHRYRNVKSIMKKDEESLLLGTSETQQTCNQISNVNVTNAQIDVPNDLRKWANQFYVKRRALTGLLKILASSGMYSLPLSLSSGMYSLP